MTISHDDPSVRRRATNRAVTLRRQALSVVRPLNQQIGYWQVTAARLISIGERAKARGGYAPAHIDELDALEQVIAAQRARLDAAVAELPEEIRLHGRITDTRRALSSVSDAAGRARELLSGRSR